MNEARTPIPAATLVLMRERSGAAPQLLFVERSRELRFAGGAVVFPGGRVDPADRVLAADIAPDLEDGAARIAAVRETLEETGLAIGFETLLDRTAAARMRATLHAGEALGTALQGRLSLDALVPFARWLPDLPLSRVFDTLFYLARYDGPMDAASVDATENSRLFWASAQEVLDQADRGEVHVIFPTRRNLERLAGFDDFAAAVADARCHPVRTITPWTELRDGEEHLCIPAGLGYPVTSEPVSAVRRG
ncbi:MAG: NUDIX hydrolase [Sphingomonas sp.]|nr:NUDIX hydrolase [Sphingomonas sp.]